MAASASGANAPILYLSPSTQDWNQYVNGNTEEYYMNLVADALVPYLRSSGIRYVRNTPDMTAGSSITQSNQGVYDLHLALHSNAAPEAESGLRQGSEVYYNPANRESRRAADVIAKNLANIYPYPWLVKTVPATNLGEVLKTRAPGVLVEFAYHDNLEDAEWIQKNIPELAANLALSLTEYFGIPFVMPQLERQGEIDVDWGYLNIRQKPNYNAPVIAKAWKGEPIRVLGQWENWYIVDYYGKVGYADSQYILVRAR